MITLLAADHICRTFSYHLYASNISCLSCIMSLQIKVSWNFFVMRQIQIGLYFPYKYAQSLLMQKLLLYWWNTWIRYCTRFLFKYNFHRCIGGNVNRSFFAIWSLLKVLFKLVPRLSKRNLEYYWWCYCQFCYEFLVRYFERVWLKGFPSSNSLKPYVWYWNFSKKMDLYGVCWNA